MYLQEERPVLSDDFLAEIQGMGKKNLALEALKKLINGEIKSKLSSRVVKTKVTRRHYLYPI